MIKKFISDVWADRYRAWVDARGPRRPVSRFRVVRYVRAVAYQFGPAGWLWAVLASGWFIWSTIGTGAVNVLVTAVGCAACTRAGMAWSRRNTVTTIEWEEECPCREAEEDQ